MGIRQDCRAKNWDLGGVLGGSKGRRGEKCEKGSWGDLGGHWDDWDKGRFVRGAGKHTS